MTAKKENKNNNLTAKRIHLLMTGGGAPGGMGILKCLSADNSLKITVADADPGIAEKYQGRSFETIPIAIAPLFAETVLDLCKEKKIGLILPLVTKELIPFAQHKEEFEKAGIKIPISSLASLEIANSKSRLYEFLQWRGIGVPAFKIVETVEQFKEAVHELGYPEKQVCFKPSISNGSRGFRVLSGHMNEMDLLFNYKPSSTYITFEDTIRIFTTGTFPELLVSEWLPGEEYSVDCLSDHGKPVVIVPRLRKKMINGISVEGEFVKEETIITYCEEIIRALQLHGNTGIQVKRSVTGQFLVLEINPRVQGTIAAGLGAGINLPLLAIRQELGLPISAGELSVKWGTRFSRHWEEVFY